MAQWIRHLTTNQGIPGSSPGRVVFSQGYSFLLISFLSPNMSIFTSFLGLNAKIYIYIDIYILHRFSRSGNFWTKFRQFTIRFYFRKELTRKSSHSFIL